MDVTFGLQPPSHFQKVCAALVAVSVVLYLAACAISLGYGAAFFSIPFFVGFVAGVIYSQGPFRAALVSLLLALLLAIVTLHEGVVCVLFALPVLLPMLWIGAFVGSVLRRHVHTRRGQNGLVGLALLVGIGSQVWARLTDDPAAHPVHAAQSEIEIEAPPEAVFAALTQSPFEVEHDWPWFIRIGLPMPGSMSVEQPRMGGRVRFDFDQGTAFARITQWEPGRELRYVVERYEMHDLPFHITRLGRGPDYGFRSERVEDWLTILDTRYTMTATADGRTKLQRRIVWRRHLAPDPYFGWLQQVVMERGQVRLLELIRDRAAPPRPTHEGPRTAQADR
jgi:hypothetical protein